MQARATKLEPMAASPIDRRSEGSKKAVKGGERRSRSKVEAIRARCSVGVMGMVRDPPDHAPDSSQARVKSLSS